ncbi:amidohydrolase family protein [Sphingomonas sp. UYP23]
MIAADTLIRNAWLITVDPDRRVFTDGFIAFRGGRIVALGAMAACDVVAAETIDARGRVVMPGMANAHNHLVQIAFRGYNDDRWPVLDIPAAVRALVGQLFTVADRLDAERTHALVRLHALELLKAGYTATHDEHFTNGRTDSVDGSWAAIAESGMRGYLTRCIVNGAAVPERGHETVEAGLAEVARLHARFASERITVATGFLNFNFVGDPEDMRRIHAGAAALGVAFGVDMTDNSRGAALAKRGFAGGQVDYYRQFGLLDGGPIYAGKAVNIRAHEFDILAEHDCRVALVPMLRFFDGQGIALHEFLARGLLPGLGTDAPLVSDCQNPFEVMRQTILAQNLAVKVAGGDKPAAPLWANAERMIEMATLGGARALFMDDVAGSLEIGKMADCVIVDTARAELQPGYDGVRTLGALVWGGQSSAVDTVFVGGEKLVEGGRSTRFDEETVVAEAAAVLAAVTAETDLATMLPPRRAGHSYRGWTYV